MHHGYPCSMQGSRAGSIRDRIMESGVLNVMTNTAHMGEKVVMEFGRERGR